MVRWFGLFLLLLAFGGLVYATEAPINVLMVGHYNARAFEPTLAKYQAACAKEGVRISLLDADRRTGLDFAQYTLDVLKQYHVIVVSGSLMPTSNSPAPEIIAAFRERLDAYYRAGGSILWVPVSFDGWGTSWTEYTGKRYDVQSMEEDLYDPGKLININPGLEKSYYRYIWTTNVTPHPVTDGVHGLFLPTTGEWSWPGTVPMKFGKSWQVLLRGMDTTCTIRNAAPKGSGQHEFTPELKGTYAAAPEIVGVRESINGSGRMMVFPLYPANTWKNFGHFAFKDALMLNGFDGHPSDGLRLLLNAYKWLAQPAIKAGLGGYQPPVKPIAKPDLSPIDWSKQRFAPGAWSANSDTAREFRGLIGARTALGGGSGTVAEYVTEAKKLGLAFIVFLEDLNKLDQNKLDQLVKECAAASGPDFLALPGFTYRDLTGNDLFVYDVQKMPDPRNRTEDGRVRSPRDIVDQHSWKNAYGIARMGTMPLDPYFFSLVTCAAPMTWEGNTLVDDGLARYAANEGLGHTYPPVSVVTVTSPAGLASAARAAHLTIFMGKEVADFLPATARKGNTTALYITNGPKIDRWGALQASSATYRPGGERFHLELHASSPAGLREVRILNAQTGETYRRFQPQGAKEFRCAVDESHKNQWNLIPVITDTNGRTAIGSTLFTYQLGNQFRPMGDRLMGMHHSRVWDDTHEQFVTVGGWLGGVTWVKGNYHNEAGGAPENPFVEENTIWGIDGGKVYPAALDVVPTVVTGAGSEPQFPAYRARNRLASFDCGVIDFNGDLQYPVRGQKTPGLNWEPIPELPVPNQTAVVTVRKWAVRPRHHAAFSANIHEITVTFKQDTTLKRINLCRVRRNRGGLPCTLFIKDTGGAFEQTVNPTDKFRRTGTLAADDYLYPSNEIAGAVGIINLGPQAVQYDATYTGSDIFIDGQGRAVTAGESITVRLVCFMRPKDQINRAWLTTFLSDYGMGAQPSYAYKVAQGMLRGINYVMDLDPTDGGAAVEIGQYDLPHNLLVRVNGLPANAIAGRYEAGAKQVAVLAVLDGMATTSVDTTQGPSRLYLGELLRCDNRAVRLSLVQDGTDFLLEVHNPTDAPQTCTLTGPAGFAPLAGTRLTVTVPPCSSEKRTLRSAPGTVENTPYVGG